MGRRRGRAAVRSAEGKRRSGASAAALEHGEEAGARVWGTAGALGRGRSLTPRRGALEPEESRVGGSGVVGNRGGRFRAEGWLRRSPRGEHAHGSGAPSAHVEHAVDLQRALLEQLVQDGGGVARAELEDELALGQVEGDGLVAHHALGAVDPGEEHRGLAAAGDAGVDLEQLRTLGRVRHEPVLDVDHRATGGRERRSICGASRVSDRRVPNARKKSE